MARKLAFDKDLALQKAMRLFWEKGYSSSSLDDLVDAMGINRFSIYNTYGDKKQLMLKALSCYQKQVMAKLIAPLTEEVPAKSSLENYLDNMALQLTSAAGGLGCFIQRTAQSDIARDPEIGSMLKGILKELYDCLFRVVVRCQSEQVLSVEEDAAVITDLILTQIQGMIFMRRAKQSGEFITVQMGLLKALLFK